jgi:hypothetical protein
VRSTRFAIHSASRMSTRAPGAMAICATITSVTRPQSSGDHAQKRARESTIGHVSLLAVARSGLYLHEELETAPLPSGLGLALPGQMLRSPCATMCPSPGLISRPWIIQNATRSARALIVSDGFTDNAEGMAEPSAT